MMNKQGYVLMHKYGFPVRYLTKDGQTTSLHELKYMEFYKNGTDSEKARLQLDVPDNWVSKNIVLGE